MGKVVRWLREDVGVGVLVVKRVRIKSLFRIRGGMKVASVDLRVCGGSFSNLLTIYYGVKVSLIAMQGV